MRIGIDACCWSNRRGYGRFTRGLLNALMKIDKTNEYVLFCDPESGNSLDLQGSYKKIIVPMSKNVSNAASANSNRSLPDILRMTRAVFQEKLDWFYSPSVYSYFPIANRCKIAVTIHDTIAEMYPTLIFPTRLNNWFWKAKVYVACRQADLIFTVSEFACNSIESILKIPGDKIHVLLEASDPIFNNAVAGNGEEVLARFGLELGDPFYLYVGGISPHKNLQQLLLTFNTNAFAGCKLLLVGDYKNDRFYSDFDNIQRILRETGTTERIILTGFLSDTDLIPLYKNTRALILPSFYEGFGLPAVEAMAAGAPVIATKHSAIPEIAPDGALFFTPGDTPQLHDAMLQLLRDSDLRHTLSSRGKNYVSKLTWELTARKLLDVLIAKYD